MLESDDRNGGRAYIIAAHMTVGAILIFVEVLVVLGGRVCLCQLYVTTGKHTRGSSITPRRLAMEAYASALGWMSLNEKVVIIATITIHGR